MFPVSSVASESRYDSARMSSISTRSAQKRRLAVAGISPLEGASKMAPISNSPEDEAIIPGTPVLNRSAPMVPRTAERIPARVETITIVLILLQSR